MEKLFKGKNLTKKETNEWEFVSSDTANSNSLVIAITDKDEILLVSKKSNTHSKNLIEFPSSFLEIKTGYHIASTLYLGELSSYPQKRTIHLIRLNVVKEDHLATPDGLYVIPFKEMDTWLNDIIKSHDISEHVLLYPLVKKEPFQLANVLI